jgi:integrase
MKLNDAILKALPFQQGQRDYPDSAVSGLSVRVGTRTKTFMLTLHNPHRRRMSLGHYPDLSLAAAREKARDLLAEARFKKSTPVSLTFDAALEQFKRLHVPTMRRLTQKECTRLLTRRFTALSNRSLAAIKTSELAIILDGIAAPLERRNAFVWLRVFMTWCYRRGYIDENPMGRLKAPPPSKPRERALSMSEIVTVWRATYHLTSPRYAALVRILILSGQRRGQWQQFRQLCT